MLAKLTMGRALLLGLILGAFYYFAMFDSGLDKTNSITAAQAQIVQLDTQIRENQIKLDRAAVYKKNVSDLGSTIKKLLAVIPEKFGPQDLMKIVSNEAKVAGSSMTNLSPHGVEVSKVAKEFEEQSLTVDLTGTFQQHMLFLSNLTRINQILTIRRFDLQLVREARPDEPPLVRLSADIVAYRYLGDSANAQKPVK